VHIMSAVSLTYLNSLSAWHLGRDCRGARQSDSRAFVVLAKASIERPLWRLAIAQPAQKNCQYRSIDIAKAFVPSGDCAVPCQACEPRCFLDVPLSVERRRAGVSSTTALRWQRVASTT
jgi:hypothetical protein